jgi:hypothetical protein
MAEYTANALQNVLVGQNVLFTDVPIPGYRQGIIHREGSGIITLSGRVNNCSGFARYKISFGANVAIPTGGTASTPIVLALAIDGEPIPTSSMIVTPAEEGQFWNIYASIFVDLPKGCCYTIAVENTGTTAVDVQNANLVVERTA